VASLEHAIREAGREPVQRDSYYRHLRRDPAVESAPPAAESELVCA
jgi:2-iminoacetate synthase ThiH